MSFRLGKEDQRPVPDMPIPRSIMQTPSDKLPSRPTPIFSSGKNGLVASHPKERSSERSLLAAEWQIRDENVRSLPPCFPLERTNVSIKETPAKVVGSRIAEFLYEESISAFYDEEKATALAETPDHTTFHVRLFRDNGGALIVELQRRDGSAIDFHNVARRVLRAAQGLAFEKGRGYHEPPLPECAQNGWEDGIKDALELTGRLLSKDRLDANILGMESLKFLTDMGSGPPEAARFVSRQFFSGKAGLLGMMVSLVVNWRLQDFDGNECRGAEESRYYAVMHSYALTILANVLLAASEDGSAGEISSPGEWLDNGVLSALVGEVASAKSRPHDSLQAARCLNILCSSSDDVKLKAKQLGAQQAASTSLNEGCCKHALLARESKTMIRTIESNT